MIKFRVLPQSQLSERDFDEYPVWSEHYDCDEIEDIERWGLDREKVLKLFKENSPGNEHCVYTLLEVNPFLSECVFTFGLHLPPPMGAR
jgi:hypothetical protein